MNVRGAHSGISSPDTLLTRVRKRAVLVFAENLGLDLARRRLPRAAERLLSGHGAAARLNGADVHLFTTGGSAASAQPRVHAQTGATFSARLENATATLRDLGYDEIVMIGRDCPQLCERDIRVAFAQLNRKRLVLGPDHRGGCYLIAFRAIDYALLEGIRWRQNTDCAQLRDRCAAADVSLLAVKQDLDSWADLRLLARGGDWAARIASRLVSFVSEFAQARGYFVDLAAGRVRVRGQMPPPALVG
jgi:2-phospho-L-lactate guanylyltransferase (CobY/MobA/RfbA family)